MNWNQPKVAAMMAIGMILAITSAPMALRAGTNDPPPATAAAGDWQKLFTDETWYRQHAGSEEAFTGTLEVVQPPMISTQMRTSFYKLGDRSIYTAAKRVPALEALSGKKIEIRGKAVDMALEGRQLREIWPAAVRVAPGGTTAP